MPRPARGPRPVRGLLREILFDPERDHCPRARPVVALADEDDPAERRAIEERALRTVALSRRGTRHGRWAELAPEGIVPKVGGRRRRLAALRMRWYGARPIVLPGALDVRALAGVRETEELFARLDGEDGLAEWLRASAAHIGPELAPGGALPLAEPERDRERYAVAAPGGDDDDLWVKTGRLSTHPADRSLRLRVAFGREVDDDASADGRRHELVRRLAERLLPAGALLARDSPLAAPVAEIADRPLWPTQPIVYWNAPEGGALFHHDAFPGPPEAQQAGVVYAQLAGRTAWLAIAIGDLALRVREFLELADADDLPEARAMASDLGALVAELGLPGCGSLGPLVNRGPDFTSFLADSGHAWILGPGDAIVLPNFGLDRTAMHSVFCASDAVATGLSVALRRGDG